MKLSTTLKDVASIQTGYPFRSRVEYDPEGQFRVIQPGDIISASYVDEAGLTLVSDIRPKKHHMVRQDEVLFNGRGENPYALLVNLRERAIASALFFIIRPDREGVLPGYLAWYLNQSPAQAYFNRFMVGSAMKTVKKKHLDDLPIPIPPLAQQRLIAKIDDLVKKEEELVKAIQEKRHIFIENLLLKSINGR